MKQQKMMLRKLHPDTTCLLVCDVQEKFRGVIWKFDSVIKAAKLMVEGCRTLDVPQVATEQYPKALGQTISELSTYDFPRIAKMDFSMCTPQVKSLLASLGPGKSENVLIVGLETHVCVLQTALDLLEMGKTVHIVVDGVSSQRPTDRDVALRRLERAGAVLTTCESALFQLMVSASHPKFKIISNLVKEFGKDPSTLPSMSNL
jgi:nicotinamidase-related amidase